MSIIYKYLIREIFKIFGIVLALVIGIYVFLDFIEKIDNFMEAGLPFSKAFIFFFLNIPFIISQITPIGILLAVLVVFGLMSKNNEIIALKCGGISIYYLLRPVLTIGIVLIIFLFFVSDVIVPITSVKANRIWYGEVKKKYFVTSKEMNIWIKEKRLIVHINYYHPKDRAIFGVTINNFDKNFRLIRRVDAKKGIFKDGKWYLYQLLEQNLNLETGDYVVTFHENRAESLEFIPADLSRAIKKPEEMSFKELFRYVQNVEAEGYDATTYRVDLQIKIALPFIAVVMCIVGTGMAVREKIKSGLPMGITYGLGTAFLYWVSYSFCVSLGYGGVLPPFLAVWTANFVFLCLGFFLLLNAE